MQYRRANIKGGTYFFTVNLENRQSTMLVNEISKLRNSLSQVKQNHPFSLDAMVVLPDHLHIMMTLPEGDDSFAKRLMLIKSGFSRQVPKNENINSSRKHKGERGIWQRRYWEHLIRDQDDYGRHFDYIHYNPVKHGYVGCAADWRFSTIHKYIKSGVLASDWGSNCCSSSAQFYGEG